MKAYRFTIAALGALLPMVVASISAGYLAVVLFPFFFVVGGGALWLALGITLGPLKIAALGALALTLATVIYASNDGNWNQPGLAWVSLVGSGGVVLLGVNIFAIYARSLTSNAMTLFGGPVVLASSAAAYWWLLDVDASRADLYMLRADALFVGLYSCVGLLWIMMNRTQPGGGTDAASSRPSR